MNVRHGRLEFNPIFFLKICACDPTCVTYYVLPQKSLPPRRSRESCAGSGTRFTGGTNWWRSWPRTTPPWPRWSEERPGQNDGALVWNLKRSGRRKKTRHRRQKWWIWWDKRRWRCWKRTDGEELGCSYWTEWEDWVGSTGSSQRKWREGLRINNTWRRGSTWTHLRHAPYVKRFLTLWCTKMGFVIGKCELQWSQMVSLLKFQFIFWQSCQCLYLYYHCSIFNKCFLTWRLLLKP